MRSIVISVSVCLSVFLFLRQPAYLKKRHVQILPNFLHILPAAVARLCTSGFTDDVMFPHNDGNTPESKTTRMFRPIRQVATPVGRQATLFG